MQDYWKAGRIPENLWGNHTHTCGYAMEERKGKADGNGEAGLI